MSNKEYATRRLLAIQEKNQSYFTANQLNILNCVQIVAGRNASVHVINNTLPFEIRDEIELIFWV